ncbi:TonB-dependent receptor [uncultured Flavobacterium sp.]|uniref:SusC/RagA family TonB-linked outer membrane protein n=1 Tax=uncultured Flavobacterium sp. TaxID=165435 RepID=UPI00293133A9|nr:TonB-dependent receptor [uncultured Flavobacterium sp.]
MKKLNLKYQPFNKALIHLFVGMFVLMTPVFTQAQSKIISGIVQDEKKDPLPGVTILVKGTKEAAVTDYSGQYKIKADSKDQLTFSYMGFETTTVTVGNKTSLNVVLKSTTSNLDEIVVIGYGSVKRKDLTGSVSSVSMSDFRKSPVRSFDEALAGRVAGVQVTSSDGRPGSGTNIVIRGNNSVTQANSPLYVIDGFLIEDPNNNIINPNDIESIEVLKDASATAIYGSRGANGVIVIQTKKGKEGKPVFAFSSSIGIQQVANKMDVMNTYEFVKYQLENNPNLTSAQGQTKTPTEIYLTGPGKTLEDYRNVASTDWQDLVTRTALFQNNNISVSGGTKKIKYSLSGSHTDQDGILLNSNYLRYQGRANVDYKITNKLKIGVNSNYSYLKQTGLDPTQTTSGGSGTSNLMTSVWGSRPYTPNVNNPEDVFMDPNIDSANDYRVNPVLNLENTYNVTTTKNIAVNGYLEYLFTKDLKFRTTYGFIENHSDKDEFYNTKTAYGRPGNPNGVNGKMMQNNYNNWLNENTLTWEKQLGAKSKFTALGGFTAQKQRTWSNGRAVNQLLNEDLMFDGFDQGTQLRIDPSESVWTMSSFLGRVNYNYDSKYMITASFRADGSSKFPSKNHWGYFPSGAVSWKFNEEKFLKNFKKLSEGKIRLSYGQTGNNRVGDFDYLTTYYNPASPLFGTYTFDRNYVIGVAATKLGNPDLKWETTEQIDAGIDLGFFNQRITFTADVYQKTTKDLLLKAQLPLSTGFTSAYKNVGSVRNRGLELSLVTKNIVTDNFTWTSSFNISFNKNELLALAEGQDKLETIIPWDFNWSTVSTYVAKKGESLGDMYGFEYSGTYKYDDFNTSVNGSGATVYALKPEIATNGNTRANIQPGDVKYKDQNGDGVINKNDYTKIGNGLPVHTGGFSNNFTYKNFDLNIFFQWSYGNNILNANRILFDGNQKGQEGLNQFASYQDRWSASNPNSDVFRTKGLVGSAVGYSSFYVEDGSYLRLKSAAIGYNFDQKFVKKMHLKSLRFALSAQNIFTWTKYSGTDPEVNTYNSALTPGFDFSAYPRARTVFFATNITF